MRGASSQRAAVASEAGIAVPITAAEAAQEEHPSQPQPQPQPDPLSLLFGDPPRRFSCTECGKCCTGGGEVWVNDAEVAKLAAHLHLQLPQFKSRHVKQYSRRPGWHMLRSQPGAEKVLGLYARLPTTHAIPYMLNQYPCNLSLISSYPCSPRHSNQGAVCGTTPPGHPSKG